MRDLRRLLQYLKPHWGTFALATFAMLLVGLLESAIGALIVPIFDQALTQYMQYGEKAYLLPRDDISWKLYVDQWLHLAKVTGNYQKILGQWIATPEAK